MKPKTPKPKSNHADHILNVGKEKGYITYKQVNDILPAEVVSTEEVDEILLMLGENDIKIVDPEKVPAAEDDAKEADAPPLGPAKDEDGDEDEGKEFERAADGDARAGDPVKTYLHQMGRIPLL